MKHNEAIEQTLGKKVLRTIEPEINTELMTLKESTLERLDEAIDILLSKLVSETIKNVKNIDVVDENEVIETKELVDFISELLEVSEFTELEVSEICNSSVQIRERLYSNRKHRDGLIYPGELINSGLTIVTAEEIIDILNENGVDRGTNPYNVKYRGQQFNSLYKRREDYGIGVSLIGSECIPL